MTIEINPRLIGVWFIDLERGANWMAGLKEEEDGRIKLTYRFRYDAGGHPWDGRDEKVWREGHTGKDKASAIAGIRDVVKVMELSTGNKADEILMVNGDVEAFMREFAKRPYANVKTAAKQPDGTYKTAEGEVIDETGKLSVPPEK